MTDLRTKLNNYLDNIERMSTLKEIIRQLMLNPDSKPFLENCINEQWEFIMFIQGGGKCKTITKEVENETV